MPAGGLLGRTPRKQGYLVFLSYKAADDFARLAVAMLRFARVGPGCNMVLTRMGMIG